MIHKPVFSIIVPVYNVENYLNACVQSLINQTFSDIEIILVSIDQVRELIESEQIIEADLVAPLWKYLYKYGK